MSLPEVRQQIDAAVLSWTGVSSHPHRWVGLNTAWGGASWAISTATTWWIFPFPGGCATK